MQHQWKQIKHKDKLVIAWKCENCEASAGRHFADWPEDRPPAEWLKATKLGEECMTPLEQFNKAKRNAYLCGYFCIALGVISVISMICHC